MFKKFMCMNNSVVNKSCPDSRKFEQDLSI
jgi:hypothetical protein